MSIADKNSTDQALKTADDLGVPISFPPNFFWGAATSAYQIEGATQKDGRGPSIWDYFSALPGKTYQGHTGEIAADHYHRMREDVDLMARMGLTAYRFSVAWSRIQPAGTGAINAAGLDFYERLVDALLARGITPLVTLYHWDLPLPLHEKGGWPNRNTAYAFADYAEIVAKRLGDRVDWWLTHNEPWCTAFMGYGNGLHAPGVKSVKAAVDAAHHVLLSHGLALPRIRAHVRPCAQLGIALNLYPVSGVGDSPGVEYAVKMMHDFKNGWFLDPIFKGVYPEHLFEYFAVTPPPIEANDMTLISSPLDFVGINYYSRTLVQADKNTPISTIGDLREVASVSGSEYTAMNWEVYPQGLEDILAWVHKTYGPKAIFITENGAAFDDAWDGNDEVKDECRAVYLRQHIYSVGRALERGVPMRGYFAWSLLDNYEWAEGYNKRFGIVYVDYASQRRIVKKSGHWYAQFVKAQSAGTTGVPDE